MRSVLALVVVVVELLEQYGYVENQCGAMVSVQKVFERIDISDETYDVGGQRIHSELLRYTVPRANGKRSTNVGG